MKQKLKNFLKGNKGPAPRSLEEIRKEAGDLTFSIGNEEYICYIKQQDVARYKKRLQEVNQEGAERIRLDQQASEATKQAETKLTADKAESKEA